MILHPEILRHSPQLAAVEMLTQTAETVIIALCAAHPAIEHTPRDDQRSPSERLADRVVDNIMPMLDALDQYRRLLHDLNRPHPGPHDEDDRLF